MNGGRAERARRCVLRRCHEGLDAAGLAEALTQAVADAIPLESWCWHTIDPATVMLTGAIRPGFDPDPRFGRYEYSVPDINKFAHLAHRRRTSGVLGEATHGHPASSARYRDLLAPLGIRHELRASFVADGRCWAACSLYRVDGRSDFSDDEAAFVASLSKPVAEGFRRALLIAALDQQRPIDGPGLVLLDDNDDVASVTPEARGWLDQLVEITKPSAAGRLPAPVYAVAARTRAIANSAEPAEPPARVRARSRTGGWLTLHGSRLAGRSAGLTAVIIEPAHPVEIAAVIVEAYDLTDRERAVAQLVLQGRSTRQISDFLHLSPLTVQDHLKSIFDKTGVRSRRDLVARVFAEHYAPRLARGDQPVASGYFA
ncbi:MAG: helix-turn-helix transcriptional regulator [Acidimicrobiales bacterium]